MTALPPFPTIDEQARELDALRRAVPYALRSVTTAFLEGCDVTCMEGFYGTGYTKFDEEIDEAQWHDLQRARAEEQRLLTRIAETVHRAVEEELAAHPAAGVAAGG